MEATDEPSRLWLSRSHHPGLHPVLGPPHLVAPVTYPRHHIEEAVPPMTTIRTRCDVCRLDSDQPPSEVAIYDGLDQNHFMVLFQCLECGEYNRQEIQLEKAQILISAGVIHISVLDVAELLLDDDHGIERELSAWAEEIH